MTAVLVQVQASKAATLHYAACTNCYLYGVCVVTALMLCMCVYLTGCWVHAVCGCVSHPAALELSFQNNQVFLSWTACGQMHAVA